MEGFTVVDGVVVAVVVVSALLAYSRGLVRELMAIVGWIAAAILAFIFAKTAEPLVKEIPFVGDFLRDSCELSIIAAFSAVFAIALILVSIFTPLFSTLVQRSALNGIDQGLGFLFGALRGIVLVVIALVVYDRVIVGQTVPMVDNSRTAAVLSSVLDDVEQQIPEDAPGWVLMQYEALVGHCATPAPDTET